MTVKISLVLLLSAFVIACSGRDVISQEREYVETHIKSNPELQHYYLNVGQHKLHYIGHGDPQKPALIIVHGTPGDWRQYARYLLNRSLLDDYYMVVIDRPGWGESSLATSQNTATFKEQAFIIAALAKKLRQQNNNQAIVLMGHSLGASLIPQVAMDFPELIDGLLLFAGTVDPQLSSPRWFNYLGAIPFVEYVIGDRFHRSNQEIFELKENVIAMSHRWKDIKAQVIAVQGEKDGLVYPANSNYIEKEFNASRTTVIRLENKGHLFPMTMRDEVVSWAKKILNNIQALE